MSKVKLFDLNRFADVSTPGGDELYFNPADLVAVSRYLQPGSGEWRTVVYLSGGKVLYTSLDLDALEAEINRALAATSTAAHEYADESAKEIADKLIQLKATINDADLHSMNDFTPDLNKDKKGYN